jgi:hypothetical protein
MADGHGIDSLQRLSIRSNDDTELVFVFAAFLDEREHVGSEGSGLFGREGAEQVEVADLSVSSFGTGDGNPMLTLLGLASPSRV